MSAIIEALRVSKRYMYHQECYAQQKDDIVYGVLRLRDSAKCYKCGMIIPSGPHSREQDATPEKLKQLTLF